MKLFSFTRKIKVVHALKHVLTANYWMKIIYVLISNFFVILLRECLCLKIIKWPHKKIKLTHSSSISLD